MIKKVNHSDWAAPIVVVPKGDGQIRICGDNKVTVNQSLDVDADPLPKPEDLMTSLTGGKKFTKLNLFSAYQQMALTDKSKKLIPHQKCAPWVIPVHLIAVWCGLCTRHF